MATSRSEKAVVGPGTSTYVPIKLIIGTKEGSKKSARSGKSSNLHALTVTRYVVNFCFLSPGGLHLPVPH